MNDGEIRIGTSIDLKGLEKELARSKRKIEQFDKDTEKMVNKKAKLEIDVSKTEADLQKLDVKFKELDNQKKELERINDRGLLESGRAPDSTKYAEIINQMEYINKKDLEYSDRLNYIKDQQEQITNKIEETKRARDDELNKVNQLNGRIEELNNKSGGIDLSNLNTTLQEHDKNLSSIISKVGKWALAVFGVRSAYNFVRQAASTISQYDEKIGANIEYIRFALAYTLKPVVEWLIKAVYKILQLIGAIIYQITGKNIFKNSGAGAYEKAMKSSSKSTGKMVKDSKKMKDNFSASFDEFTALQEQETSSNAGGGGSGGGGFTGPSMDLSKGIENMELPKWAQKIVEIGKWLVANKDTVAKVVGVILGLLAFNKAIGWIDKLGGFFGLFKGGELANSIGGVAVKLGLIAGSLAVIYESGKVWLEGNKKQRADLNRLGERGVELAKEDVKQNHELNEIQDFLNYKRKQGNELLKKSHSAGAKLTGTTKEILKNAQATSKEDKLYIDQQMEKFRKGELTKEQQEQLIQLIKDEKNYNHNVFNELEKKKMSTKDIKDIQNEYNGYLEEMGVHVQTADDAWNYVMKKTLGVIDKTKTLDEKTGNLTDNVLTGVDALNKFNNKKINDKTAKINVEANTSKANSTLGTFISNLGKKITDAFKKIDLSGLGKKLSDGLKKLFPNVKLPNIKNIFAREGGIINNPGRGVRIGSNIIGGEAGAEALLPLDDKTMDRLGSAIARHMVINTTNINQINGRTLSREVKQIMSENDFASNI